MKQIRWFAVIVVLGAAAPLFLSQVRHGQGNRFGSERLVSVEPLPPMEMGQMCPPESEPETFMASAVAPPKLVSPIQQDSQSAAAAKLAVLARKPISTLKDPRNAFSGLVIDPRRNEVVIAEENNFSFLVYDRLTNTPSTAALSEPKRIINGEETYIEYACGVYVDPESGDIYGINNDTLTWMTVFDRNAKGNARPTRKLATPYSTYGIVADEETQELMMTVQEDNAVITFKKSAQEQDAPVRLLQGAKTQMADPHGIALDPKTGLIYVTNWGIAYERRLDQPPPANPNQRRPRKPNWSAANGRNVPGSGKITEPSITVYRKDDHGDVAPIRVIQGSKTQMNWPTSIAAHPDRGELFVANDTGDSITVYKADADGDVAPIRVIKGPRSMVKNPTGVALDLVNNELWVANFGSHSATVYSVTASGDAVPARVIRSGRANEPSPMLSNPHTLAFDTKRDQLLVSN